MAEGLKLYKEFNGFLKDKPNVKMAWFTTFNLSLPFFERYMLSAIAQTDYKNLRSLKDYEALNERLFGEESDTINIKVFHDYRALPPEVKRTSVPVIGIDPSKLDAKFRHGVFHPKVALIVDSEDNGWLFTGSANLTLSAWSSNSECAVFKKIEDKQNAQSIVDFFMPLLNNEDDRAQLNAVNAKWQAKLGDTSNWTFQHSLSGDRFMNVLQPENTTLYVWSPYFSDDIPAIITNELGTCTQINIIPDRSEKDTVKIAKDVLENLKSDNRVLFHKDTHSHGTEFKPFVHAKVWLTENKLAIGSWNFTYAGLNLSDGRSNVEAGVVQTITPKEYESFLKSSGLSEHGNLIGVEKDQLEDERRQLVQNWSMSCQVIADWSTYRYHVLLPENTNAAEFFIELPGIDKRLNLELVQRGVSFKNGYRTLLKDRVFTVFDAIEKGRKVYMGVIQELKPSERPAFGFDSINDLIRAWTDGKPENKQPFHELNYTSDLESGDELQKSIEDKLKGDYSQAWFSMFLAFEHIKERIHAAQDNPQELRILGFKIPGSVIQLRDHLLQLKNNRTVDDKAITAPYLWFLIEEANQVIALFNRFIEKELFIESIAQITLPSTVNPGQLKQWLSFIKEECAYPNV
jgi:hypothetical protein